MLREAATVAAGTAAATLAIRHVELLKALLSPATAGGEERAPSLVLLLVLAIIGFYQITTHVFHPPIIAVFGGKPKVVLTQDHAAPGYEGVKKALVRNLVQGRLLAVQCVVFRRGERVVDLCGAPEPITVAPPPPPPPSGGDDEDEGGWEPAPDAYHPHAVQPVRGPSAALVALAAAIAVGAQPPNPPPALPAEPPPRRQTAAGWRTSRA